MRMPDKSPQQRLRLIGCLALIMAPHFVRMPAWVGMFVGAILV